MNNGNPPAAPETTADTTKCPGCGGQVVLAAKRCPHCGRPTAGSHSFSTTHGQLGDGRTGGRLCYSNSFDFRASGEPAI